MIYSFLSTSLKDRLPGLRVLYFTCTCVFKHSCLISAHICSLSREQTEVKQFNARGASCSTEGISHHFQWKQCEHVGGFRGPTVHSCRWAPLCVWSCVNTSTSLQLSPEPLLWINTLIGTKAEEQHNVLKSLNINELQQVLSTYSTVYFLYVKLYILCKV